MEAVGRGVEAAVAADGAGRERVGAPLRLLEEEAAPGELVEQREGVGGGGRRHRWKAMRLDRGRGLLSGLTQVDPRSAAVTGAVRTPDAVCTPDAVRVARAPKRPLASGTRCDA